MSNDIDGNIINLNDSNGLKRVPTCHPFDQLTPDFILNSLEELKFLTDGRLFPLNSYENRVYQIGIENSSPIIGKFYRPNRWTKKQILEEHQFCFELAEQELPVVAPMISKSGESLFQYKGFYFALFPRKGGYGPELDDLDNLYLLGKLLGRLHAVGAVKPFNSRHVLNSDTFGHKSSKLISEHFIPAELKLSYDTLIKDLMQAIDEILKNSGDIKNIRVHGDCHGGNILWRDGNAHFVDLDDAMMAPAVQDVWMLLSGNRDRQCAQLSEILDGYNEFFDFHPKELKLIDALRTLRMINYTAWIAKRWVDPAFPIAFPWFNTIRFWSEHILELREQFAALGEPSLKVF
ncbi:MAG: serine/threonine protein kinase [Porticoccus sp.]|jgi:Ser/Thr protein kinase RdoA (MazF antagonist)|nr:serine/threonine protein kinase [Porticoccus sp.]|tara:strand:- start:67 stop:1110 length:1044 start_codon:yes stop_codon:yes gene_type:complete